MSRYIDEYVSLLIGFGIEAVVIALMFWRTK